MEICLYDTWETLIPDGGHWGAEENQVVCRELGLGECHTIIPYIIIVIITPIVIAMHLLKRHFQTLFRCS